MATANPKPILIIGAGELGTAVLSALATHPKRGDASLSPLSVLLRPSTIASSDPSKQASNERLRSLGAATLEPGDVGADSEEALAATFTRYHAVVVCAGMGFPPGTQLKIARAAVLRAQVPRFVPWQWGIDYDIVGQGSAQDLFDEQLAVRNLLRGRPEASATTNWVIVSVGLFMSFLFHPGFGVVDLEAGVVRALGSWDTRVTVTDVGDIARVAAEVVWDPRGGETRDTVVFAGGDTVTYGHVAELVGRRFVGGTRWRRKEWSLDVLRRRLEVNPDDGMVKYQNVFGEGRGVAWDLDGTINRRRGLEMTTVQMYLARMEDLKA
ncbi:hypothetical protein MGN70_011475 [Eutypa lata]|nr:hypothetical protein MGN70_011475 [Eutypa lata]